MNKQQRIIWLKENNWKDYMIEQQVSVDYELDKTNENILNEISFIIDKGRIHRKIIEFGKCIVVGSVIYSLFKEAIKK